MPDRSAERAAEVLAEAEARYMFVASSGGTHTHPTPFPDQVAALMADPVIVDLAIEAGWLVEGNPKIVGWKPSSRSGIRRAITARTFVEAPDA